MAEEFKVKVGLEVDTSKLDELENRIKNINNKPVNLKVDVDSGDINKAVSSATKSVQSAGKNLKIKPVVDTSAFSAINKTLTTWNKDNTITVKTTGIETGIDGVKRLRTEIRTLDSDGKQLDFKVSVQDEELIQAETDAKNLRNELKQIDEIKMKLDAGDISNQVSKTESDFGKIANATKDAQSAMDEFEAAQKLLNEARTSGNNNELISGMEQYETALKKVKNQIDINIRTEKDAATAQKLMSDKNAFSLGISKWLKNNSAAAEDFGGRLRKLQAELKTCDSVRFSGIKSEFKQITTEAELVGKTGLTFGDRFKQQFSRLGSYFSAASVIMAGIQVGKEAIQNVIDIDTQMTELYRVTDLSTKQYSQLYDKLTVSAKEYGVALTDLISATADWSRAGFDADTAAGLAEITSIYQHIADLDYDTSVDNLLTAYKGFQDQLSGQYGNDVDAAVMHIADVYNEIDNNYSATAADIGEAVKRSASALSLAGNSLEETAGMVTGITEVTQDPEKAGNSLKVLSMRIRGMKGELQDLGEEVDDNVENISQMQGKILNLTHGKVNIFEDDGSFKSTYEIMQGIANIYDDLTDSDRADLLETIAGKNRANEVAALIQNWDRVEQATESAANSTGSAMKEQEKYADSIQGRLNSLQSMWQQLSNTFISSDLVKTAVSAFTGLLNIIEKIINTIGGVGTAGIIGTFIMGARHSGGVKNLFSDITYLFTSGIKSFGDLGAAAQLAAGSIIKAFTSSPAAIATGIGIAVAAISTIINLIDNAIEKTNQARQETIDLSNNFGNSFQSFEEEYRNYSGKTNLTQEDEEILASAINGTVDALGEKSSALQSAIGSQNDYAANLESIAQEELKQSQIIANDAKQAAKEQISDFWGDGVLSGLGLVFSGKGSKFDFQLPKDTTKEFEAIKDIVDDKDFQKYLDQYYTRENGIGHGSSPTYFRFNRDTGLDEYIEQLNYVTEIRDRLNEKASETGDDSYLDSDVYKNASSAVDELSSSIGEYTKQTYNAAKASYQLENGIPKTIDDFYKMQDAVLSASSSSVEGRVAIANLMSEEYGSAFDLSTVQSQVKQLQAIVKDIDNIDTGKERTLETFIDMKTKVNEGECSVGDFMKSMDAANDAINEIAKTDSSAANALRIQLGIEVDADGNIDNEISKLRDKFVKQLTDNNVEADVAEKFVDGLNNTELEAAVNLVASGEIDLKNIDTKNLDASIKQKIEDYSEYLKAIRFNLDIDAETTGLDDLNTALSESRAATGLTADSIQKVEDRYSELEGYNPAGLFEKTTTGVRLNTEALQSLEEQYVATNKAASDQKLGALAKRYKEIEKLRDSVAKDSGEYKSYQLQLDNLQDEIDSAQLAAAAYDGLTSAYNNWINAKSGGQAGDMYDQIIEGQEAAKKLAEEGKWGNSELQNFIEMFTAPDAMDNATPDQFADAWGNAISKSERYFQEGRAGIDNFLSDVASANSELVKMNQDGSWEIQPGFDIEDWAKAAGVAESTVESVFGMMEEYGVDVPIGIDETSIDDLVAKSNSASEALKSSLGQDFSIEVNTDVSSAEEATNEIDKLKSQRDEINNSSATVEVKEQGVEAVNASIQATIDKKIELEQPAYMQLDTSQVKSTMIDALTALQNYQNAVDEVKNLEMQQDAGIEIDTTQLDNAKEKVDETAQAIAQLDGDVKIAIGLDASDSVDDIKKKIESGEVKLTVDTDVNKTATEELASNIEKIESKDVTITAKVEGLDDVKELSNNIDIAAKVDGNIEDLTKFTEAAKGLNDVSDNITTTVSASVYGNLDKNKNLDKLSSFIDNAKELDGVKSSYVDVTANVNGNLDKNSINVDNLSEFAEGAKALQGVSSSDVSVKANLESSGLDNNWLGNNSVLDNINKFAESAERLSGVGDASVTVTANLESEGVGNNILGNNSTLDNLNKFAESAKNLQGVGDASVTIQANLEASGVGNDLFSSSNSTLDNLEKFAEGAKQLHDVEDANVNITANLNGNIGNDIFSDSNSILDNLEKFADSARSLEDVKDASVNISANLDSNVGNDLFSNSNSTVDNLQKFAEGAKKLDGIGDVSASVSASLKGEGVGDNFFGSNSTLDNMEKFADGAKKLQDVENVDVSIKASLEGQGVGNNLFGDNSTLDNLEKFSNAARKLNNVEDVDVSIKAVLDGDIDDAKVNRLDKFADGAKKLQDVNDVSVTVTANLEGKGLENGLFGGNSAIDNLEKFAEGAKKLQGVGDVSATITANLDSRGLGNGLFGNSSLNNLEKFADGAEKMKSVGDASATVTANLNGNIGDGLFGSNSKLDNLEKFADGARKLNGVKDVSATITANLNGNIGDGAFGAANSKLANLGAFADGAKKLDGIQDKSVTLTANINGNIGTSGDAINNLPSFASTASTLQNVSSKDVTVTANVGGNITSENIATLSQFGSAASSLPQSTTVSVNANIDTEGISNAKSLLQGLNDAGVMHNYNASVTVTTNVDTSGVDSYQPGEKTGTVKYNVDQSAVDAWSAPDKTGTITYNPSVSALTDSQLHKTGTITYKAKVEGGPVVNGTAHVNGTVGSSFANGDWSTKSSGTALMGELGPELIVRGGRYFTVGDSGAEFAQYKKGDIIFNHKQTEELFKNGYVTSGGGRGRALVDGTAFANVNHATWKPGVQTSSSSSKSSKSSSSKSSSSKSRSSKSSSSSDEKEFEESLDWIEIAISRIERAISNLDRTASSTYKTWTARNSALNSQIGETRNEIELQQRAYERYIQQANSVGLSESYASKVRDGTIDIETITDEGLNDKIKDYQTWYEKALDCLDAIDELRESESKLYEQRFNNVSTKYDGYLGVIEHEKDMLDEFISQTETAGYIVSTKYYDALSANAKKNIEQLKKERDELTSELNAAVNSGTIDKYSESW